MSDRHLCTGEYHDSYGGPAWCECAIGADHHHDDWLIERYPEIRRIPREMCEPERSSSSKGTNA
jgi:hypothetical protein